MGYLNQGPFLSMDILDRTKYKGHWCGQNMLYVLVTVCMIYPFYFQSICVFENVSLLDSI